MKESGGRGGEEKGMKQEGARRIGRKGGRDEEMTVRKRRRD